MWAEDGWEPSGGPRGQGPGSPPLPSGMGRESGTEGTVAPSTPDPRRRKGGSAAPAREQPPASPTPPPPRRPSAEPQPAQS